MKKILSFVLVLSLVLGSFSMAFAAKPATTKAGLSDIKGNANEDAIQVAYDLGIVTGNPDGTYLPAKTVTRAEFAAMITKALAVPDSALTAKSSKFKDTNGYSWAVPYLAFCDSKGIMLGDGKGNAMPGRNVTANEAVTMVLRAIGYTANSSELTGTWPSNYVTVAQNSKLYDDVTKNAAAVDKANAAQIIYNALTVQKVSVNSDGKTEKLEITDPTDKDKKIPACLINTGLDCTQKAHVVTGEDYDNAIINVTKYMGANGTAYLNDDKDIVAFTVKDCTALTGEMDGSDFKVGDVKYTISSKANDEKKVNDIKIIKNTTEVKADSTTKTVAAKIQDMDNNYADDLVTINADVSGKTINQVYSIVGWHANYADTVDQNDLDDMKDKDPSLLTYDFDKDDNGGIDKAGFALVGVDSLEKIAKDNVVYVYADGTSDKNIRKVAVGTQTVKGLVAEADVDNSDYTDNYVKIDGKIYEQARFNESSLRNKLPDLDDTAVLSLDAYGYVYDTDATGGTPDKYGIITAFDNAKSIDNAKAKIYTMDDSSKTLTFDDWKDVKFTSQSGVKAVKFSNADRPTTIATPSLIGYDVDKSGDIIKLDYSAAKPMKDIVLQSTKVLKIGPNKYLDIDKDVVVFSYSGTTMTKDTDYDLSSIKDVDTNKDLNTVSGTAVQVQYIQNDDGDVVALFVNDEFTSGSNDNVYAVINSVTKTKDGSDDVQKVVGLAGGKDYTAITDDDDDIVYSSNADKIGLYVFEPNGSGNIKVAKQLDYEGYYKNDGKKDSEQCLVKAGLVNDINSDKDVFTIGNNKFSADSKAIVYKAVMKSDNKKVDKYEVAKLGNIKKNSLVWMYDVKTGDDHDGIANVIIFQEDIAKTPVVDVKSLSLNKTAIELVEGNTFDLTATVDPSNATVTWSSSDNKIATVNNGKVTAVAAGLVKITASAGTKTAACDVTVKAKPVDPSEITATYAESFGMNGVYGTLITLSKAVTAADVTSVKINDVAAASYAVDGKTIKAVGDKPTSVKLIINGKEVIATK